MAGTTAHSLHQAESSGTTDDVKESSTSATVLLRTLKSSKSENFQTRLSVAKEALELGQIPRIRDIIRQWILDEWIAPAKEGHSPILDNESHRLFAQVADPACDVPFTVIDKAFMALLQHNVPSSNAPLAALYEMLAGQSQASGSGRWVEVWVTMVKWLGSEAVLTGGPDASEEVSKLVMVVSRHLNVSPESCMDAVSYKMLLAVMPDLAQILERHESIGTTLMGHFARTIIQLPANAFADMITPSSSSSNTRTMNSLPLLLQELAAVRYRNRHFIFTQPSSSKVPYETYIAQSLRAALLEDFRQAFEALDGAPMTLLDATWLARLGLWQTIRKMDVRIESVDAWRPIVAKAARQARAMLEDHQASSAGRVSIAVLACMFQLDHQAVALTEADIEICLRPSFFGTTEADLLLRALICHHRLQRTPGVFIGMLCNCITKTASAGGDSLASTARSGLDLSDDILGDIHSLISNGTSAEQCWSIITASSKRVLESATAGRPARPLQLFSRFIAGLLAFGYPAELIDPMLEAWPLDETEYSAAIKSDFDTNARLRLTAVLTIRAMLPVAQGSPSGEALLSVLDRADMNSEQAIFRYLFATTRTTPPHAMVIDVYLQRLEDNFEAASALWRLLSMAVLKRFEQHCSDAQLDRLAGLILSHPVEFRQIYQTTSSWELRRFSAKIASHAHESSPQAIDAGLALPSSLQSSAVTIRHIQQVGSADSSVSRAESWLQQVNTKSLTECPADLWYEALTDSKRHSLAQIIIANLLEHSNAAAKTGALMRFLGLAEERLAVKAKPTLGDVSAVMAVVDQVRNSDVSWVSLRPGLQASLTKISGIAQSVLERQISKDVSGVKLEKAARLALATTSFFLWSGAQTSPIIAHTLLNRIVRASSLAEPALPILLAAASSQGSDEITALYVFLHATRDERSIDNAMSSILLTIDDNAYASLWSAATARADSSLLQVVLASGRDGSGKIVRSRLTQILAQISSGALSCAILATLWRDRARCFSVSHAVDAWGILGATLLSAKATSSDLVSLLDAAIIFCQQRGDLLPDSSAAMASTLCVLFSYFRGRPDEDLAKKTARLLDGLGRGSSSKRKLSASANRRITARTIATHLPMVLVSYARACTDPTLGVPTSVRRIIDSSLADLCSTIDPASGKAFDSIGLPYGLGDGFGGEAEAAVWAGIWRSWKRKRYTGQG